MDTKELKTKLFNAEGFLQMETQDNNLLEVIEGRLRFVLFVNGGVIKTSKNLAPIAKKLNELIKTL